jgi:hypothetical protein
MENRSFTALVEYRQPSYEELKKQFDCVYDRFENREFKTIDACKDIGRETREIIFELVQVADRRFVGDAMARLLNQGLRPALYEEMLAFAAKFPDEQKKYPIYALGSRCDRAGDSHPPFLDWDEEDGRLLLFGWSSLRPAESIHFLAVRS